MALFVVTSLLQHYHGFVTIKLYTQELGTGEFDKLCRGRGSGVFELKARCIAVFQLSDELLIYVYRSAIQYELEEDFIMMLREEITKRGLSSKIGMI